MEFEKTKKNYRMISRMFILLGAIDILIFIAQVAMGEVSIKNIGDNPALSYGILIVILVVGVILACLEAFIKIYLGVAGLKQADGKLKGTLHLTVAKIIRVLLIISLVFQAIGCIIAKDFAIAILSTLLTAVIFSIYYIKWGTEIALHK